MVDSWDDAELAEQPEWVSSGFGAFESFILNFLVGGGGERERGGDDGDGDVSKEGGMLELSPWTCRAPFPPPCL